MYYRKVCIVLIRAKQIRVLLFYSRVSFSPICLFPISVIFRVDVNGNVKREKKEEIKKLQSNNMTALVTPKPSCGSCYGAESDVFKCCNTCEDVKKAYFAKGWALKDFSGIAQCGKEQAEVIPEEGCRVEGTLKVSKISGSFHLVPGTSNSF